MILTLAQMRLNAVLAPAGRMPIGYAPLPVPIVGPTIPPFYLLGITPRGTNEGPLMPFKKTLPPEPPLPPFGSQNAGAGLGATVAVSTGGG